MRVKRCITCSAPLPSNSSVCEYCGSSNPLDMTYQNISIIDSCDQIRPCPHCKTEMETVRLDDCSGLEIERCQKCFGFFFDMNELEQLLDYLVKETEEDPETINKINEYTSNFSGDVIYKRCPVCHARMRRLNFGYKSGIIYDFCDDHGIFLDSGELDHLVKWCRNGGAELNRAYKKKLKERKRYVYTRGFRPARFSGI